MWNEPAQKWYWYGDWSRQVMLFEKSNICRRCTLGYEKHNTWKRDGTVNVMSECIIHAPHRLQVLLAILFNSMVINGTAAEGLLEGSMTPIHKSQAMTRLSDKYLAITLRSLIGKIFDLIILRKQKQSPMSDDLQFGFKEQSSTTLCTNMLLETANHFVSKGNKVLLCSLMHPRRLTVSATRKCFAS